jgi:hypothetical protein
MTLYVVEIEKNKLITHDGEVQLGMFTMSIKQFLKSVKEEYTQTYWLPDTFSHRYKRVNYQKHLNQASIGTKDDKGR